MTLANSAGFLSEMALKEEATAGTAETVPAIYDYFTDDPAIDANQNVVELGYVQDRDIKKVVLGGFEMTATVPQIAEPEGALGHWLKWCLGGHSAAQQGGTSAYLHTFTPADALKSFTMWLTRGNNQEIKIPYAVVQSLEFKQAVDDALRLSVGILGKTEQIASDIGSPSYSVLQPFANQHLSVSIAGSTTAQAALVYGSSVKIENGYDSSLGKVHGSRFYQALVAGKRRITGELMMWFDDDVEYQRFWGATDATEPAAEPTNTPLILEWDTGIEADTGYNYKLTITIPDTFYTSTKVNVAGGRVSQKIDILGIYDTSTSQVIKIELTNTKTTY
jgi:hypothetical protein